MDDQQFRHKLTEPSTSPLHAEANWIPPVSLDLMQSVAKKFDPHMHDMAWEALVNIHGKLTEGMGLWLDMGNSYPPVFVNQWVPDGRTPEENPGRLEQGMSKEEALVC